MLNRRLLMAQAGAEPPGGGVVQDGLVFRLDGTNQGSVQGKWVDVINGIQFNLNGNVKVENGVRFSGAIGAVAEGKVPFYSKQQSTIQIAIKDIGLGGYTQLFDQADGTGSTWAPGIAGSKWVLNRRGAYMIPDYPIKKASGTYSFSELSAWESLRELKQLGAGNYWPAHASLASPYKTTLMQRAGANNVEAAMKGTLYEIRIYNRILTDAEILQNQQYDIDTYFGGVAP